MHRYLENVHEGKEFHLGHKKIRNLNEMLFELKDMSDEQYEHYVSEKHNYISDWILHVVKYKALADSLRVAGSRKQSIDAMQVMIKSLNAEIHSENQTHYTEKKEEIDISKIQEQKQTELVTNEKTIKEALYDAGKNHVPQVRHHPPTGHKERREFLWTHFSWDIAKEFMYGMSIGILAGMVLSKIFLMPV